MHSKKLVQLFIPLSILHLLVIFLIPEEWAVSLTTKLLPMFLLIFILGKEFSLLDKTNKLFLIGIIFSTIGDAVLSIPFGLFLLGLGSFFIAHLLFIYAFTHGADLCLLRAIPFYLIGVGLIVFLFPSLNFDLRIPVIIYSLAISTMGWRAASRNVNGSSLWLGVLGAIFFILSDSLIAFAKLAGFSIPHVGILIMSTYYIAQYLLFKAVTGVNVR